MVNYGASTEVGGGTSAFYRLKPLDMESEQLNAPIALGPEALKHGTLENGMRYYVLPNKKPQKRAAMALAVCVGSVAEEEEERGLAHMVEHLAFNHTVNYENHQIVRFLESIGAEFGACQNAYTSSDETVFELLVPTDKPGLLEEACKVLAEFADKISITDEDVARERGAVLEEWRQGRDARGRAAEAHWKLVMEGSKYADRLPIGLESVIRTAPASVVRNFYTKWYRPEHMAVLVVGDFEDSEAVLSALRSTLGMCSAPPLSGGDSSAGPSPSPSPPPLPCIPFTPHAAPRYSAFADSEASQSLVYVSFKHERPRLDTPAMYKESLVDELFCVLLNARYFKLSRKATPPFYNAGTQSEEPAKPVQSSCLTASCPVGATLVALEALLTEVARVRLYGFSARELRIARARLLSDLETRYLEKDQAYSSDLREEYVRHFLYGEFVCGQETEARLAVTLLPLVTPQEIQAHAHRYLLENSCVVKSVEHRKTVTEQDLKAVAERVADMERQGEIHEWPEGDQPDTLMDPKTVHASKPVTTKKWESLDVTELTFSNGMKVAYKCTDFLDDQVLISGFAHGGLAEVPQSEYRTAACATLLSSEIGVFGFKPEVLSDIVAGKRCNISPSLSAYKRSVSGEQSPLDLETALQMLHLLFTSHVTPSDPHDLMVIRQMTAEGIRSQQRDPLTIFSHRVNRVNYGGCYYFKPMTVKEFMKVDVQASCQHFSQAFSNPKEFTVILIGALQLESAVPLIEKYLGGLPSQSSPLPRSPASLTPLPFAFPEGVVEEEVRVAMVETVGSTQLTFPVALVPDPSTGCLEEVVWVTLACRLLESRLLSILRFNQGEVYSVQVNAFFGAAAPSSSQGSRPVRGDIAVNFSCDPMSAWRLRDLALEELARLQEQGPTQEDVNTVVELETRAYEIGQQENSHWLERILAAYQSSKFEGNVDLAYNTRERIRKEVLLKSCPDTMREAFKRIFPYPCKSRYSALTLLPQRPWYQRPVPLALALVSTGITLSIAVSLVKRWRR